MIQENTRRWPIDYLKQKGSPVRHPKKQVDFQVRIFVETEQQWKIGILVENFTRSPKFINFRMRIKLEREETQMLSYSSGWSCGPWECRINQYSSKEE